MSLLHDFIDAKSKLDKYKKLEAKLRVELLNELFPTAGTGTFKTEIEGLEITGSFKNNVRIDQADFKTFLPFLTDEELSCIKYTPSLITAKYSQLHNQNVIDDMLVTTPAMPTITITLGEQE